MIDKILYRKGIIIVVEELINLLFPIVDTDEYSCNCGRPSEMCDCGDYDLSDS